MYKKILLPVDLDQESSWKKALPVAVEYCQIFGARLHLMTVLPSLEGGLIGSYFPPDFEEKARAEAKARLDKLAAKVSGNINVTTEVATGPVYEEILTTARSVEADLIVMASHRPELKDYLLGPNAARVVRHSDISVLVVRGQ